MVKFILSSDPSCFLLIHSFDLPGITSDQLPGWSYVCTI